MYLIHDHCGQFQRDIFDFVEVGAHDTDVGHGIAESVQIQM